MTKIQKLKIINSSWFIPVSKDRIPLALLILLLSFLITLLALVSAFQARGIVFPSFFTDPYGFFSVVYLPEWGTAELSLYHPDKVLTINERPIEPKFRYGDYPIQRIYKLTRKLYETGDKNVTILMRRNKQEFKIQCQLREIGKKEIIIFFGLYAVIGWLILWAGLIIWIFSEFKQGAKACLLTFFEYLLFMLTLFDYHTTTLLTPVFTLSTLMIPPVFFWLAFSFPTPLSKNNKLVALLMIIGFVYIGFSTIVGIIGPMLGLNSIWYVQLIMDFIAPLALIVMIFFYFYRLKKSEGIFKKQLLSVSLFYFCIPITSLVLKFSVYFNNPLFHIIFPFIPCIMVLVMAYSIIMYNIVSINALLAKRCFTIPLIFIALFVTCCFYILVVEQLTKSPLNQAIFCVTLFFSTFYLFSKLVVKVFLPTTDKFILSLKQVNNQLTSLAKEDLIKKQIIGLVEKLIPTMKARIKEQKTIYKDKKMIGNSQYWSEVSPLTRHLVQPLRIGNYYYGYLEIFPQKPGTLFSHDDLSLISYIANIGSIALCNVPKNNSPAYCKHETEHIAKTDKNYAIETLGAEIAHEIKYSLNYFQFLLNELKDNQSIDNEDITIGQEEMKRMDRLILSIGNLQQSIPQLREVNVLNTIKRTINLLKVDIDIFNTAITIDIPCDLNVIADTDPLLQLFANLIRNSIQASGKNGKIDVIYLQTSDQGILEFNDSGKGFPDTDIFSPWVTTKKKGAGLGLTICQRIVRSFDWTIQASRKHNLTCFSITIPIHSIVGETTL